MTTPERPQTANRTEEKIVLVVDDTQVNIIIINNTIKSLCRVRAATNGPMALKLARLAPRPHLILLDIMMPEMDGIEVCRQLKADPDTATIPIIFATAKDNEESSEVAAGLALGANGVIHKPIDPQQLLHVVRQQLQRS
ncbi:MAG: response regulator [Gammaproteobacteria bacterium]|nr:response regulator [Gammaproteobacteria bacterium]